jgi:hypothetical protein
MHSCGNTATKRLGFAQLLGRHGVFRTLAQVQRFLFLQPSSEPLAAGRARCRHTRGAGGWGGRGWGRRPPCTAGFTSGSTNRWSSRDVRRGLRAGVEAGLLLRLDDRLGDLAAHRAARQGCSWRRGPCSTLGPLKVGSVALRSCFWQAGPPKALRVRAPAHARREEQKRARGVGGAAYICILVRGRDAPGPGRAESPLGHHPVIATMSLIA